LGEQDGFQGGWRPGGLGRLREDEGGEKKGQEDWFDRHGVIALGGMAVYGATVLWRNGFMARRVLWRN
jgi:hypothetical protein